MADWQREKRLNTYYVDPSEFPQHSQAAGMFGYSVMPCPSVGWRIVVRIGMTVLLYYMNYCRDRNRVIRIDG